VKERKRDDPRIAPIEEGIEQLRQGKFVIIVDDEDRENEGDLAIAAQFASPEAVNFMITQGRGLVCVAMTGERLGELGLPPMVSENTARLQTAFHVSVDAAWGTTTGISAHDRSRTVQCLIDPATRPADLARPGHVFPLRAQEGGVLVRAGQTEASVDLARAAGLYPAAVICEVVGDDGKMARLPQLLEFGSRHQIQLVTVEGLIAYRQRREKLVRCAAKAALPTRYGEFTLFAYESLVDGRAYLALVHGQAGPEPTLVRVHSSCLTGDVFHSRRCDCGEQLERALEMMVEEGRGVLLYVPQQEGRGIGLLNKIRAYQLQEEGHDTVEANALLGFPPDLRAYGLGAQVLRDLGLREIRLLTNNPRKVVGIEGHGLTVVERVPLVVLPREENLGYLKAKREKLGHLISADLESAPEEEE
jgi:3,4-dihydroxy 2-butanone 4-phosphate synthase/GTP cyclohydrolase II